VTWRTSIVGVKGPHVKVWAVCAKPDNATLPRSTDGAHRLIEYEALLKSLFANCRAIGLCLYNREQMPLAVIRPGQ
jgi:hypothetical protein